MAKIKLHGILGEKYGKEIEMFFTNGGECLRAMMLQLPGFTEDIKNGQFVFNICGEVVEHEKDEDKISHIRSPLGKNDVMEIIPVPSGAGGNIGVFQIVIGVIAIAAAAFTGGSSIALWSAWQVGLAVAGASMVLGGVATMMTKTPKTAVTKDAVNSDNTSFSSVDNMAGQGQCHPLIYGRMLVGSFVISQSIETL